MKKVISIFAVVVMAMGMFSCDKNSANGDDPYVEISANDKNGSQSTGGSGGM